MTSRFYAGVGSRDTPQEILTLMESVGEMMARRGWTLRSGGARGADIAFETGCDAAEGTKEIFLPWKGFNDNPSILYGVCDKALVIAANNHPNWERCSPGVRKLMARNCYQVLGNDLRTPSNFVLCWTVGGRMIGGTGAAIVLARNNGIPVYNLGDEVMQGMGAKKVVSRVISSTLQKNKSIIG